MKKSKPHTTDWPQIDRYLKSAEKRLSSARKILEFDEEACLQQAYEAMLRASLAFMYSEAFLRTVRCIRPKEIPQQPSQSVECVLQCGRRGQLYFLPLRERRFRARVRVRC